MSKIARRCGRWGMGMLTMLMGEMVMGYNTAPSMGEMGIGMRYRCLKGDEMGE